jgi:hypothetical protein
LDHLSFQHIPLILLEHSYSVAGEPQNLKHYWELRKLMTLENVFHHFGISPNTKPERHAVNAKNRRAGLPGNLLCMPWTRSGQSAALW